MAWSGDVKYVAPLNNIVATATPETQTAAYDAVLRLADAIILTGGNWDAGLSIYKQVLTSAPQTTIRGVATMGLGRNGDATVIDEIVAGAAAAKGELDY